MSFCQCCPMKRYTKISAEMWGVYSLLWYTVYIYIYMEWLRHQYGRLWSLIALRPCYRSPKHAWSIISLRWGIINNPVSYCASNTPLAIATEQLQIALQGLPKKSLGTRQIDHQWRSILSENWRLASHQNKTGIWRSSQQSVQCVIDTL